jgi:uncharacterized protein YcbX
MRMETSHAADAAPPITLGEIAAIYRYPVKSMRGESVDTAVLGWHGLAGDRRVAFRKLDDRGGFPWLTAGRLPELLHFSPLRQDGADDQAMPTHVRTPEGQLLPAFGEALAADVARRYGAPVEMMQLRHGIFDDACVSVIALDTVREIGRLAGAGADVRRFRPNIVIRCARGVPFEEDDWVGGVIAFGDAADAAAVTVTTRDVRCAMVNIDPDGGPPDPAVLKAVVRANANNAGVYGTVTRVGRVTVGQPILLWR